MLAKFSELTGMEIKDMGELDLEKAATVAEEIETLINSDELKNAKNLEGAIEVKSETKWVCEICGRVHYGDNPPETCPLCGVPSKMFKKAE